VFFTDNTHGWIAGGYFDYQDLKSILLKTDDGGEVWDEYRFDKYLINDMYFSDSLHGWAVGNDTNYSYIDIGMWWNAMFRGIIMETWDGGVTWSVNVDNLPGPLNSIYYKGGYIWAVGENGLVLKYRDPTWIDDNKDVSGIIPEYYELNQNYPNPFNPVTIINYQLPMTSDVNISIYNLLGQKVATLINERKQAGYHQVEWDATGFASGVYYYRMVAGNYVETRKMIYLK